MPMSSDERETTSTNDVSETDFKGGRFRIGEMREFSSRTAQQDSQRRSSKLTAFAPLLSDSRAVLSRDANEQQKKHSRIRNCLRPEIRHWQDAEKATSIRGGMSVVEKI
ncbi:hypothetical protein PHSY_004760 [Pseudozyma hubeiensis SY62]|uniref:Uncharacterized protein n=1 Tax=Pseudozyma hubeiensis (strain SY62) TaxID=1305764 RepID=R9PGE0_PSEHS|nr:hypothetical protein PHSY_004760 [Pseudozyma hubeiensis SY62]GAC97175.1 hypothetical protein PHSY_004760 [Pseudozyma hubeiensis SY62]